MPGQVFEFAEGPLEGRRFILVEFEHARMLVEISDLGQVAPVAVDEFLSAQTDPAFASLFRSNPDEAYDSTLQVVPLTLLTRQLDGGAV